MCATNKCESKAPSAEDIKKLIDDAMQRCGHVNLQINKDYWKGVVLDQMLRKSSDFVGQGIDKTLEKVHASGAEAKQAGQEAKASMGKAFAAQGKARDAVREALKSHQAATEAVADGRASVRKAQTAVVEAKVAVAEGRNAVARSQQAAKESLTAVGSAQDANAEAVKAFAEGEEAHKQADWQGKLQVVESAKLDKEQVRASASAARLTTLQGVDAQVAGLITALTHNQKLDEQQTRSIKQNVNTIKAQGEVDEHIAKTLQATMKSQKKVVWAAEVNRIAISHNVKSLEAHQTSNEKHQAALHIQTVAQDHTIKAAKANQNTIAYNIMALKANLLQDEEQTKTMVKLWNAQQAQLKELKEQREELEKDVNKDLKSMQLQPKAAAPLRAPRRLLGLLLPGLPLIAGGARAGGE